MCKWFGHLDAQFRRHTHVGGKLQLAARISPPRSPLRCLQLAGIAQPDLPSWHQRHALEPDLSVSPSIAALCQQRVVLQWLVGSSTAKSLQIWLQISSTWTISVTCKLYHDCILLNPYFKSTLILSSVPLECGQCSCIPRPHSSSFLFITALSYLTLALLLSSPFFTLSPFWKVNVISFQNLHIPDDRDSPRSFS